MIHRGAPPTTDHYLDDYISISGSQLAAGTTYDIMSSTAVEAGFEVPFKEFGVTKTVNIPKIKDIRTTSYLSPVSISVINLYNIRRKHSVKE